MKHNFLRKKPILQGTALGTRACWNMQHPSVILDQYAIATLNVFLEFPVEMILKAEVNDTHFSLSRKNPKMHIWCKFDDPISKQLIVETSQISQNFETKWPWRWKSMTSTNFLSAPSSLLEHIDVQVYVDIYMNNACIVEIIWKKFHHIHHIMLWDPNDFFYYKIPQDKLWNNSTGS